MPQDILANTITCLRNQEYDILWKQLLSQRTKLAYELREQGFEEFAAFCGKHRRDLLVTLNRMLLGIPRQEVILESLGGGVIQCRLRPQVGSGFRFRKVDAVSEGPGLKLLLIH